MTIGSHIAWDDTVLPFQLDRSDIRGRVARLDGVLDNVLKQHDYPPVIEALVAEAAVLTALAGLIGQAALVLRGLLGDFILQIQVGVVGQVPRRRRRPPAVLRWWRRTATT